MINFLIAINNLITLIKELITSLIKKLITPINNLITPDQEIDHPVDPLDQPLAFEPSEDGRHPAGRAASCCCYLSIADHGWAVGASGLQDREDSACGVNELR